MRSTRSAAVLLALVGTVSLAACSSGDKKASPSPSATTSASASATPSATPAALTGDPLTGLAPVAGPVVGVKVDNAVLARPYQRGINQAAFVYQELVEGGLTRFLAVFESARATSEVGPVRSGRETDISLLRQLNRPPLAFSGAQPGVFALIRAAARAGYLIDASYDSAPGLYRLGERRRDARNFFVVPANVGKRKGGGGARDIGFRFGALVGGTATSSATVGFSTQSVVRVTYLASRHAWVLRQGGRTIPFYPENVVIQVVQVKASRFHDVHLMNTPLTVATGSGPVVILRDGRRVVGHWVRKGYGPTHYLDAAGHDLLLHPGQTWVMLLPRSGSASYR